MGDNRFDSYLIDTTDTFVTLVYDVGTGVSETHLPQSNDISVYPNPFNKACHIAINACAISNYTDIYIFDVSGKRVARFDIRTDGRKGNYYIWEPETGSGVYLIRVKSDDGIIAKKVVYLK